MPRPLPLPPTPWPRTGGPCGLALAVLVAVAAWNSAACGAETAADVVTRELLEQLEERKMSDVAQWLIDRIAADPTATPDLKAEVPFRRALALVASSRTEADGGKRAALFDNAQKQIDEFLKTNPTGRRAIDAYSQKGNLLITRGVLRLEQAKRAGADVAALRKESVGYFDQAIKTLEGKVKPDEKEIKQVDNAEDAVIKELRAVDAAIAALKEKEQADDKDVTKDPKAPPKPKKPVRRDAAVEQEFERLEADQTALRAKLVQTRILVASAYFEKAKCFDEKSADRTAALQESTKQFEEIANKYAAFGGGLLARYYQGRNLALLGKREQAVQALADLVAIDEKQKSPLAVMLRSKALATSLECWLADKKYDVFDQKMRDFVLDDKVLRFAPEADRLTLKYRAAELLTAQGKALPKGDAKGKGMLGDAAKLAIQVAKVNRDFGEEAKKLVESLGKEVDVGSLGVEAILDKAKLALATMQAKKVEAKQAGGQAAAAATAAAAAARDEALAKFDEALGFTDQEGLPPEKANYARYMRTYLLYDAKRYAEASEQGVLLVEQFPNAMGSRQSGTIAMAALQQIAKGGDAAAAKAANQKLQELARTIAKLWPAEKEGAEAIGILVNSAIEAKKPQPLIELVDAVPANAVGRPSILGRAGTYLWREVMEQGRVDGESRMPADAVAAWKRKARGYLDEALKGPAGKDGGLRVTAAAALARAQMALDDGDAAAAVKILEHPATGPWVLTNDPEADPAIRTGSFAEAALSVALRSFIQAEQLDKAQQAMERLEKLAASGGDDKASERLTAMYFSMGRELQEQLDRLGGAGGTDDAARQKATAILGGFEKFLDGLAKRDPTVSSQIWVATTYLTLGSGKGTGAVVPRAKAEAYLDRASEVYRSLLEVILERRKAVADLDEQIVKLAKKSKDTAGLPALYERRDTAGVQRREMTRREPSMRPDEDAKKVGDLAKLDKEIEGLDKEIEDLLGKSKDGAAIRQLLTKRTEAAGKLGEVARFEPSIRLRMASIFRERGKWNEAQEQIDSILADPRGRNSLDTQVQAAEILQATGQALAATDAAAAEAKLREAAVGRKAGNSEIWGWSQLANKVTRQAFAGNDEKSLKMRDQFFSARLNLATCLLTRAQLPGKSPENSRELLAKAGDVLKMTRKMYPDLGGPAMQARFESLFKQIQKQQGAANPRGFAELDEPNAAAMK